MELGLDCLFTPTTLNLIHTLLSIMVVVSLNNFLSYVFEEDVLCYSKKSYKKHLDFEFVKDANSKQLEAYWLTRKGKINKKQKRFLKRLTKKESEYNEHE